MIEFCYQVLTSAKEIRARMVPHVLLSLTNISANVLSDLQEKNVIQVSPLFTMFFAHQIIQLCYNARIDKMHSIKKVVHFMEGYATWLCQSPVSILLSKYVDVAFLLTLGCLTKTDVVFILDSSGSVGEENFQRMKEFLKKFLDEVNVESCNFRVGVLKFGSSAFVQFNLNAFVTTEQLTAAVDEIRYSHGYTYTADAIRVAREMMFQASKGDRPDARNVLVIITEGQANVRPSQTMDEVRKARNAGIHLVPIGIGSNSREDLKAMASHNLGMFFVDSFYQLDNMTMPVADYILEGQILFCILKIIKATCSSNCEKSKNQGAGNKLTIGLLLFSTKRKMAQ